MAPSYAMSVVKIATYFIFEFLIIATEKPTEHDVAG
jgi:hypothetical protein